MSAPPREPQQPTETARAGSSACEVEENRAPVASLRALVNRLSTQKFEDAERTAALALCTLAVGIQGLDTAASATEHTRELRRQAGLLADPERAPFTAADRVKDGLEAALLGLEEVADTHSLEAGRPWLRSARDAISSIGKASQFELQRPAIQDAFRTVSAAFAVVSEAAAARTSEPAARADPGNPPPRG